MADSVRSPLCRIQAGSRWWPLAVLVIAIAALSLSGPSRAQNQDEAPQEGRTAVVHFAAIAYQPYGGGTAQKIYARDLDKVQLVESRTGDDQWVELFFRSGDYVLQRISGLTVYRRDGNAQQVKLTFARVLRNKLAFPYIN